MKVLLFLLLSNLSFRQALKLNLKVTRIPLTDTTVLKSGEEKVLIILKKDKIGLVTTLDTLELHLVKPFTTNTVYKDVRHDEQLYTITFVSSLTGFIIFITPVKPFKRRIWALNLHSVSF